MIVGCSKGECRIWVESGLTGRVFAQPGRSTAFALALPQLVAKGSESWLAIGTKIVSTPYAFGVFVSPQKLGRSRVVGVSCVMEVIAMRTLIFIAAVLGLAGCATPAERAAQWQAEVDTMIAVYGPACEKLGYKPDEDRWRDCVMRLSARDERRYSRSPRNTSCFGHRGFFHCTTF